MSYWKSSGKSSLKPIKKINKAKKISFRVDNYLSEFLNEYATEHNITPSEAIRRFCLYFYWKDSGKEDDGKKWLDFYHAQIKKFKTKETGTNG